MYSLDLFGIVNCLTRLRIILLTHSLFFASLPSALPTTYRVTLLTLEQTLSPLFTQFPVAGRVTQNKKISAVRGDFFPSNFSALPPTTLFAATPPTHSSLASAELALFQPHTFRKQPPEVVTLFLLDECPSSRCWMAVLLVMQVSVHMSSFSVTNSLRLPIFIVSSLTMILLSKKACSLVLGTLHIYSFIVSFQNV